MNFGADVKGKDGRAPQQLPVKGRAEMQADREARAIKQMETTAVDMTVRTDRICGVCPQPPSLLPNVWLSPLRSGDELVRQISVKILTERRSV